MATPEFTADVFNELQAGNNIGNWSDVVEIISDNAARSWNTIKTTVQGVNGQVSSMAVAASSAVIGGVNSAVSSGAAMLTIETGALGMAIAPAMGLVGGYALYNLSPDFWTDVAGMLYDAGWTVNNKVVCFLDQDGQMIVPHDVIEIVKNAFYGAGVLDTSKVIPEEYEPVTPYTLNYTYTDFATRSSMMATFYGNDTDPHEIRTDNFYKCSGDAFVLMGFDLAGNFCVQAFCTHSGETMTWNSVTYFDNAEPYETQTIFSLDYEISVGGVSYYYNGYRAPRTHIHSIDCDNLTTTTVPRFFNAGDWERFYDDIINLIWNNASIEPFDNPYIQAGATVVGAEDFTQTLTDWDEVVITIPFPVVDAFDFAHAYPLAFPMADTQALAIDPAIALDTAVELVLDPAITPEVALPVDVALDPDAPATPEPITVTTPEIVTPEPINPDPVIPPSPVIPPINLPATVTSSKLFTVYNPSAANLDSLGGYLWSANIIDELKKIWQNPLDGLISLIQVYCTPSVGSPRHIMLGHLDSEINAPVVTSQFVEVDCGSITLSELNQNVTDYSPYTSIHIYLPFIGITELDVNECMRGTIGVKYKIDVYTGTCLAEVSITRNPDVPNSAILYTFSGNCSQQIPLTGVSASGLLASLVGAAGLGLSIATGGGVGLAMGVASVGGMINHEMVHVSHSGNISANAGIMGQKKPYLIIGRSRPYNAQSFNKQYGYPVNQTSYLNNCVGYTRVKSVRLKSVATDSERVQIENLLKTGVIF